jgi:biopolymer transport protein ExbB/TolQ
MELSLLEIWNTMGWMARLVAIALVGMGSVGSVVILERWLVMRAALTSSLGFATKLRPLLDDPDTADLADLRALAQAPAHQRAPLARLVARGVAAYERRAGRDDALKLTRRELERSLDDLGAELRRGMGFLATVGSIAPFVGLFGTVIGIITAFQGIAQAGGGGIEAVSAGIAEALIVTALGLVVAIAAVIAFNVLNGLAAELDRRLEHAGGQFLDHLEERRGR